MPKNITVSLKDNDLTSWHATIIGSADSPYEGEAFFISI